MRLQKVILTKKFCNNSLSGGVSSSGTTFRNVSPRRSQHKLFYADVEATTNYEFGYTTDRFGIYEPKNKPAVVSVQTSIYNKLFNQTTKPEVYEWKFTYNMDFQVVKDVTAHGKGIIVDYIHDDKKISKNRVLLHAGCLLDGVQPHDDYGLR